MLWSVLALAVGLLVLVALYGWQARTAYVHLTAASDRIPVLREQVLSGDGPGAEATAERLARDTGTARRAVHGPHWALLTRLPWAGPNVQAVQTVSASVDALASDALPDLLRAAQAVDPAELAPRNGRVDVAPIRTAAPHIRAAQREIAAADDQVAGIETGELHERLRGPVAELATMLGELRDQTTTASRLAQLLPSMLGGDGPRHYLVLAQNTAEPRALGGIPGAVILLRADDGKVELVGQRPAASFGNTGTPVLPLSRAERALYGTQLGRYMQNVTATPDFPRAARLARKMWRQATGRAVDGVLTVDPYALQLMLRASGPVVLPGGQRLTGQNAADVLLNQVYRQLPDPSAQDAFFAVAASAVFDRVVSGKGDMRATGQALVEAVRQGRVLVWSAHEAEQRVLATTPAGGRLTGERDGAPVVGVYLHDRTAAKIAYYQDMDVRVAPRSCQDDSGQSLTVEVRLANNVPRGHRRLPEYVTGGGHAVPLGHVKSDVILYAPAGATIDDVRLDGGQARVTSYVHEGLVVASQTVMLRPHAKTVLTYDLELAEAPSRPVEVRTTPGPVDGRFAVVTTHCR